MHVVEVRQVWEVDAGVVWAGCLSRVSRVVCLRGNIASTCTFSVHDFR